MSSVLVGTPINAGMLTCESALAGTYLCLWYDIESQFPVHNTGSCLREVALVGHQTAAAEATRAAQLVEPLRPLGVQSAIGLLVLGLEHSYVLLCDRGAHVQGMDGHVHTCVYLAIFGRRWHQLK